MTIDLSLSEKLLTMPPNVGAAYRKRIEIYNKIGIPLDFVFLENLMRYNGVLLYTSLDLSNFSFEWIAINKKDLGVIRYPHYTDIIRIDDNENLNNYFYNIELTRIENNTVSYNIVLYNNESVYITNKIMNRIMSPCKINL